MSLLFLQRGGYMSIKIQLHFKENPDLELLEAGIKIDLIRIVTGIQFATPKGWTDIYEAVLDTGSPISTIPYSIWQEIKTEIVVPKRIEFYGIGPEDQLPLMGQLAKVSCVLVDRTGKFLPISFRAFLADSDSPPLILGFNDILTELKLVSDYKRKQAYLEI